VAVWESRAVVEASEARVVALRRRTVAYSGSRAAERSIDGRLDGLELRVQVWEPPPL
jgi:hypothetical protein